LGSAQLHDALALEPQSHTAAEQLGGALAGSLETSAAAAQQAQAAQQQAEEAAAREQAARLAADEAGARACAAEARAEEAALALPDFPHVRACSPGPPACLRLACPPPAVHAVLLCARRSSLGDVLP
jgi:hypothetical protein